MKELQKLIEKYRQRQIAKGYGIQHDDEHINGEIITEHLKDYIGGHKTYCYIINHNEDKQEKLKMIDHSIKELANAGALILAEMQRLKRLEVKLNK